ncbi:hypothetical protein [Actinocrispum wychmicini]|uniref:Uncharacterized protein n=1 Tax=Actinocrispum wychmicini TaxID=1213861 RepID=A0A4R2J1J1_9PSEU|nr:hypothetical protein [Actinocrispum wychmicini]TCO50716.1 hypothetical protein EV192_11394 [Actinocrispum wychmicini]
MTDEADPLKATLDSAVADTAARLAEMTEGCRETEDRANDITAKLRTRWQRRVEIMRSRANTDGAAKNLGIQ